MGLFRRRAGGKEGKSSKKDKNPQPLLGTSNHVVDETSDIPEMDPLLAEKARIVMKDHLNIMRDVVMKIRHEDGYAKAMYSNCPRLQHLLDRNPDLRPVFEDPRLVRINFETVYKEAGGILPEDEEAEAYKRDHPSLLVRIANSRLFKVLKLLFFIKKIIACFAGGGIAIVASCWGCCTNCCTSCFCEDALEEVGEIDEEDGFDDEDINDGPQLDENQKALNAAADYMEDAEVQDQMQRLLEDPEYLEDAIENDTELRTLRNSNPLCAELMRDPETMKILVDPDNLRALGEAPNMIELDFTDPNGFTPDADFLDIEFGNLEGLDLMDGNGGDLDLDAAGNIPIDDPFLNASGSMDGISMDGLEAYEADLDEHETLFEMDDEYDEDDFDYEDDDSLSSGSYGDDGSITGFEDEELDDAELEADAEAEAELEAEPEAAPAQGLEDDLEFEKQETNVDTATNKKPNATNKQDNQKQTNADGTKKKGMSGIMASLGVAATDIIASQIVGAIFEDMPGATALLGGGGAGTGELEALAGDADNMIALDDDFEGFAEDGMDVVEDGESGSDDDGGNEKDNGGRQQYDSNGRKISVLMGATTIGAIDKKEKNEYDDDGLESINSNESDEEEFLDEGNEEEEDDKKKASSKVFGAIKRIGKSTVTTFKETALAGIMGDDFAEMMVEKQEERAEERAERKKEKKKAAQSVSDSDDDSNDSDSDDSNGKKTTNKKFFRKKFGGFLGRKRGDDDEIENQAYDIEDQLMKSFCIGDDLDIDETEEVYNTNMDETKELNDPNFVSDII